MKFFLLPFFFSGYLISRSVTVIVLFNFKDPQIILKLSTCISGIFDIICCILRKEIIISVGNLHTPRACCGVAGGG